MCSEVERYTFRWGREAWGLYGLALLYPLRFLIKRAPQIDAQVADVALLLPKTVPLHQALVLARKHARFADAQ